MYRERYNKPLANSIRNKPVQTGVGDLEEASGGILGSLYWTTQGQTQDLEPKQRGRQGQETLL